MKKKEIFPNNKQEFDSYTCGPSCVLNILEYYGIKTNLPNILKELGIGEKDSTYVPQLARYLMGKGFETIILSSCPDNFSPDWSTKSKTEIINLLKRWVVTHIDDIWLTDTLYLLFYLMERGNISQLDLSTKILDQYLDKKYKILACIDETWIWGKRKIRGTADFDSIKGHVSGHYIVIYGKGGNDYLISDPYPTAIPGREGLYRVSKDKALVSILVWAKEVVALKKDKSKVSIRKK